MTAATLTALPPLQATYYNDHPEMLERFNGDVAEHRMSIMKDDGLYRHVVFAKAENSWHCRFELITSPGQLTIRGDMGTYVFAREEDMFGFFEKSGYVNAGYWGEKLAAIDGCGYKVHDEDKFKAEIIKDFWDRRQDHEPAEATRIWSKIKDDILDDWVNRYSRDVCYQLMESYQVYDEDYRNIIFRYDLSTEEKWDDYSAQYLWCCHAVLWGIRQYRAAKAAAAVTEAVAA